MKLHLLATAGVGFLMGLAVGCQTYDFEPVSPLAVSQYEVGRVVFGTARKPNLMLLVDKSGSMDVPADASDPDCPENCGLTSGNPCPVATCPTRWSELQVAMDQFLTANGAVARMGLTLFPSDAQCGGPGGVSVPIASVEDDDTAALQSHAEDVNAALQEILSFNTSGPRTQGGTPASPSLRFVGELESLNDPERDDFVLFLTDGAPNCNADNPNNYNDDPVACQCTSTSSSSCASTQNLLCLDDDATVAETAELNVGRNIRTIVVGFGDEATDPSGALANVLIDVADAGGFIRRCESDTDCAAGVSCDVTANRCEAHFFTAANAGELAEALGDIAAEVTADPCVTVLSSPPSSPELISVLVGTSAEDAEPVARQDEGGNTVWSYDETAVEVHLEGELCDSVIAATPSNPVYVEIRILQAL